MSECRSNSHKFVLVLCLISGLLVHLTGCANAEHDPRWQCVDVPPATLPPDIQRYTRDDAAQFADAGYALHLVVAAAQIDLSSWPAFVRTSRSPAQGSKFHPSSGHSWVVLESPEGYLFRGQTGNLGVRDHDMARQFMERQKTDHPNPISVLWENQRDGQAHTWPEGHTASFALRLPISREMHQRVKTQVALYDFSRFSVAHNQCTDLVAQCAAVVGLPLQYRVLLTFAPTHRAYGRDLRFWTDAEYQTVNMGSPDRLEASLRYLQGRGIGQASTALINKIIEQTPHTTENWLPYVKRNP